MNPFQGWVKYDIRARGVAFTDQYVFVDWTIEHTLEDFEDEIKHPGLTESLAREIMEEHYNFQDSWSFDLLDLHCEPPIKVLNNVISRCRSEMLAMDRKLKYHMDVKSHIQNTK